MDVNPSASAWLDIQIAYGRDTEYPYRTLSFTQSAIEFQKRDATYSYASRVVIWRYPISQ